MKTCIFALLISFFLTVIFGIIFIPMLKKMKAGQTILKYVEEHKSKNGTPTMGGLFFTVSAIITFFIFCGFKYKIPVLCSAIGFAYMSIGFLDDFIKIKFKKNEGLKAYQKIIFQLLIALVAGIFAYKYSLTKYYLPFTDKYVDLGLMSVPLTIFIFISITNSVNLTDGLDGLASGTSVIYLAILFFLVFFEMNFSSLINGDEGQAILKLISALIGGILGFLIFNTNKASVFMGDTGSLALGGFIGSLSIFTGNSLFIPILGIMFVVSGISVIMQVAHYKRTKRRIFLMAPFHHHLQHKGIAESKISYIYSLITLIAGLSILIIYV